MVKVRIQLKSEAGGNLSPFAVAREVAAEGGLKAFYKGYLNAILNDLCLVSILL